MTQKLFSKTNRNTSVHRSKATYIGAKRPKSEQSDVHRSEAT